MYKLDNGQVIPCPTNLPNWSGYGVYVAGLPISERQELGWVASIITSDTVTTPTLSIEQDAILVPPPVPAKPAPVDYSKRLIRKNMAASGYGEVFAAFLESAPAFAEAWADSTTLQSDDPDLKSAMSIFCEQTKMPSEQLAGILAASVAEPH